MAFRISNNALPPGVIKSVGVHHDTVAIETGNQGNISGFGNQVENTGIQYMQGLESRITSHQHLGQSLL